MSRPRFDGRLRLRTDGIPDTLWSVSFFMLMLSVICFGGEDEFILYLMSFFAFVGYSVLLFFFRNRRNLRIYLPLQTIWYGAFILLAALSGLWADSLASALYPISRMIQVLAVTYCMEIYLENEENLERYITAVMAATLFMIVYIFVRTPRSRWFSGFLGQVTQYNTNDVGCALSVCVLFAFYEAYVHKKRICYVLAAAAFFTAILTSSRKALLMCVFGILMIVGFNYRTRNYILRVLIILAGLTAVMILIYQIPYLYGTVGMRMERMFNFVMNDDASDKSLTLRSYYINMAKMFFNENPVLGIGINNFSFRIREYNGFSAYAHNNYMEIASDLGIVGLVVYYWFYLYLVLKLFKQTLNGHKNALLFLSLMLLFIVFEYGMVNYYKLQVQMGIAAALSVVSMNDRRDREMRRRNAAYE